MVTKASINSNGHIQDDIVLKQHGITIKGEHVLHNNDFISPSTTSDNGTQALARSKNPEQLMNFVYDNVIGKDAIFHGPFGPKKGRNISEPFFIIYLLIYKQILQKEICRVVDLVL